MSQLINLLPPEKKIRVTQIFTVLYLRSVIKVLLTYSLLIAAVLIFADYSLAQDFRNFKEQTASIDKEYQKINSQITQINGRLEDIDYIHQSLTPWTKYLAQIFSQNPSGIVLSGLDLKRKSLSLRGRAQTRNDLLRYKADLEKLDFLTPFRLPLASLTAKENIDFNFDIVLQNVQ